MEITERQVEILDVIVQEYIKSAQPVSSQLLEKKRKFDISSATIRNEMQALVDNGYIYQPYTSAGRIPADKGYRFFVDELLERKLNDLKEDFAVDLEKEIKDFLKLTQTLTKFLASKSSNLALGYLFNERIFWKEGWREIFREPEFEEADYARRFAEMIDSFEKNIEKLSLDFSPEVQIYIGKENPVSKAKDFSVIASRFVFPGHEGIFAILGPKRMNYNRNIGLINSLTKLLEKF